MKWAALIAWVITAGGGFVLMGLWLKHGGTRQQAQGGDRIRPPALFSHSGLAAGGLVAWIAYVASDVDALAWASLAALVAVVLLGFAMFAVWLRRRRTASAPAHARGDAEPAEQQFPVPIVALHGLLGAATLVLVALAAAGVGE